MHYSDGLIIQNSNVWSERGSQGNVTGLCEPTANCIKLDAYSRLCLLPVEELFTNFTLSLMTFPNLGDTIAACDTYVPHNIFDYRPGQLVGAYGAGLGVAFFCAILGCLALFANGRGTEAGFAAFFEAVKHSHLSDLGQAEAIRYGKLTDEQSGFARQRAIMGLGDDAMPLVER